MCNAACRIFGAFLVLFLLAALPALGGGIAIRATHLSDNGDDDGYADTHETVTLRLTIENTSGTALSGVVLNLEAVNPDRACVTTTTIAVGNLAVDESRTTAAGFVFTVGDLDRTTLGLGPYDPLSASFQVSVDASTPQQAYPSKLHLDLDLDVSGGSGPVSVFESFEDSLGLFEVQNLDDGRASLAASDGFRCQYNDPDYPNSNTFPFSGTAAICHLGSDPVHAAQIWWGRSGPSFSPLGGRGFSGFHSLFFGLDLGPPKNWTTPTGIIEAAAMVDPVNIAVDALEPTLTFKHQVSLADSRAFGLPYRETYDRGVVMVQLADDLGLPVGPWMKIDPWMNPYDQRNSDNILNCSYDPTDDGSTEDDFYSPNDPNAFYGPSSTCYPELIYANQGETELPFDPANVGLADGPGLQGLWGVGTWVEARFDLSQFRGRRIRVRFLASTLNAAGAETWEDIFTGLNPNPGDDGWWVDDVEVLGAIDTPAAVAVDTKDNSGLPGVSVDGDSDTVADVCDNCPAVANGDQVNGDFDSFGDACDPCPFQVDNFDPDLDLICGNLDNCPADSNIDQANADGDPFGDVCDCAPIDGSTFSGASEVNDGRDNNCPGDAGFGVVDELGPNLLFNASPADTETIRWSSQSGALNYDLVRSLDPSLTASCTRFQVNNTSFVDTTPVQQGRIFFYVARARSPNTGSFGVTTGGAERTPACAP